MHHDIQATPAIQPQTTTTASTAISSSLIDLQALGSPSALSGGRAGLNGQQHDLRSVLKTSIRTLQWRVWRVRNPGKRAVLPSTPI